MRRKSYKNLPIIAIAGPTATGKTEVALALAKKINAEIVSCDSMQIYKGFAIGTAKPHPDQMKAIPHHLIGKVESDAVFSAAEYLALAMRAITNVRKRKKNVIIAGGTGLYMKTLFEGIFKGPDRDRNKRTELKDMINKKGLEVLYEQLKEKDPDYACIISENDERRIIRALEVIEKTGKRFSELQKKKKTFINDPYHIFCLTMERKELYQRINNRVDTMMEQGLTGEAKTLSRSKKNTNTEATLMQAIGYKELFDYFDGNVSLQEAVALIKRNTRRFAKRQFTWFRKMKNVIWIEAGRPAEVMVNEILTTVVS